MTSVGSSTLSYLTPGAQELTGYGSNTYHNGLLGLDQEIIPGVTTTTGYTRQPDGTPVAQRTSTTKQYLFGDRLGSITALADDNANSLTRTYSYDPDGNRTSSTTGTGSGVVTDLGFAAGHLLPNTMYHYGARFYDPSLARWTQQDPLAAVASQQNANRYAYVGGDSVNQIDPTGLLGWKDVKAAARDASDTIKSTASVLGGAIARQDLCDIEVEGLTLAGAAAGSFAPGPGTATGAAVGATTGVAVCAIQTINEENSLRRG
jgi:RHS repeat-associated protein